MSNPTFFQDDATTVLRVAEVPNASFVNGANRAGSCAAGIGINLNEGAVVGTPDQFTLLDQFGNARAGQRSQHIGGSGYTAPADYPSSGGQVGTLPASTIRGGTLPTEAAKEADTALDGTITIVGNATLATLGAGWTEVA